MVASSTAPEPCSFLLLGARPEPPVASLLQEAEDPEAYVEVLERFLKDGPLLAARRYACQKQNIKCSGYIGSL